MKFQWKKLLVQFPFTTFFHSIFNMLRWTHQEAENEGKTWDWLERLTLPVLQPGPFHSYPFVLKLPLKTKSPNQFPDFEDLLPCDWFGKREKGISTVKYSVRLRIPPPVVGAVPD